MRYLLHIPKGFVTLITAVLLLAAFSFFAVTRTEVGRDELRKRLEARFAAEYNGSLTIEHLSGNLAYILDATGVEFRDSTGAVIIRIDSVHAEPKWRSLLLGRYRFGRIYVVGAEIDVVRGEDGSYNLGSLFARKNRDDSFRKLLSLSSADLRITDTRLHTSNTGSIPDAVRLGKVFDYLNSTIHIDGLRATVDWRPEAAQVDVIALSGSIAESGLIVESMQGQLISQPDEITLTEVQLKTPGSEVRFSGTMPREILRNRNRADPGEIEIAIEAQPLSLDELSKVLPTVDVRSTIALNVNLHGPFSALVLEKLEAKHRRSHLSMSGTVVGLPDSADFEVAIRTNALLQRDVVAVVPTMAGRLASGLDSLVGTMYAHGVVERPMSTSRRVRASANIEASSFAGTVAGSATVNPDEPSNGYAIAASFGFRRLNPAIIVSDPRLAGSLTGSARLRAIRAGDSLEVRSVDARLGRSRLGSIRVDSLIARSDFPGKQVRIGGRVFAGGGTLDLTAARTEEGWKTNGGARALDIGQLVGIDSLTTSINGSFESSFSGSTLDNVSGRLDLDLEESVVRLGRVERVLAAGAAGIAFDQDQPRRTLTVSGSYLDLTAASDLPPSALTAAVRGWVAAFTDPADRGSIRKDTSTQLAQQVQSPSVVEIQFHILDSESLLALAPGAPQLSTDARGTILADISADRLAMTARLETDSLVAGRTTLHRTTVELDLVSRSRAQILGQTSASVRILSDSIDAGPARFAAVRANGEFAEGGARVSLSSGEHDGVGPLRTSASITVLPASYRVILDEFDLRSSTTHWVAAGERTVEFGDGTIAVTDLVIINPDDAGNPRTLHLDGIYSGLATDSLLVTAESFDFAPVAHLMRRRLQLDGRISGYAVLSSVDGTPVASGDVRIRSLSLNDRILGTLDVQTRYLTGDPDLALHAELRPLSRSDSVDVLPYMPQRPVTNNVLDIDGTIRIPRLAGRDDGSTETVALTVRASRVDIFFFEDIFSNVVANAEGYLSGTATVTGPTRRPVFAGQFEIPEASFSVPRFGLTYAVEGAVSVDSEAIRLTVIRVSDGDGGTALISGDVIFNDYRYFSLALRGSLEDLQIMNISQFTDLPFYGDIRATANATLSGPIDKAVLTSSDAVTSSSSELFIPVQETAESTETGFIVFADSTGQIPDIGAFTRRRNVLSRRAEGERRFIEGLEMDLNIFAPQGSSVNLVFDPLLGDVMHAIGSGRVQLDKREGEFSAYGTLEITGGSYLFTAGDVFVRRFDIDEGGTITWDGNVIDAVLDIPASYRTRASLAGLDPSGQDAGTVPLVVRLDISGRVSTPEVDLRLAVDTGERAISATYQGLETILNQPERQTEYATSVLLTNTFLLTTDAPNTDALTTSAFHSVSQLVASQVNRYLSAALPNVDFNFGVLGENAQELDLTYGIALRLMDERLVIRGQGVYQGRDQLTSVEQQTLQGEFVVEVRLSPSVSVEVFYRRENDVLADESSLTSTTGVGLSYQAEFISWRRLINRLFGGKGGPAPAVPRDSLVVAGTSAQD